MIYVRIRLIVFSVRFNRKTLRFTKKTFIRRRCVPAGLVDMRHGSRFQVNTQNQAWRSIAKTQLRFVIFHIMIHTPRYLFLFCDGASLFVAYVRIYCVHLCIGCRDSVFSVFPSLPPQSCTTVYIQLVTMGHFRLTWVGSAKNGRTNENDLPWFLNSTRVFIAIFPL